MNKKRLNKSELKLIGTLIKKNYSLNEISKILGRSKTTIYYHFRKIKGRYVKPVTLISGDEELIGEFIGLFAGDGSFYKMPNYKYNIRLHFNSTEANYVDNLIRNVLIKLFGKKPMMFKQENRINLCYYSKNIYEFVKDYLCWDLNEPKTYSVRLKKEDYSSAFMVGFIRGSLDSDGYLSSKKVSFATVSPGLKESIIRCLDSLDLSYSVRLYKEKRENRRDIYHVNILRKDFNKFYQIIKPRNIKGLNAPAGIRISERPVQF